MTSNSNLSYQQLDQSRVFHRIKEGTDIILPTSAWKISMQVHFALAFLEFHVLFKAVYFDENQFLGLQTFVSYYFHSDFTFGRFHRNRKVFQSPEIIPFTP